MIDSLAVSLFSLVGVPLAAFVLVGLAAILNLQLKESGIRGVVSVVILALVLSTLVVGGEILLSTRHLAQWEPGHWFKIGNYEFEFLFRADALSFPILVVTTILSAASGLFSFQYLHREEGFSRFFLLYLLFVAGMNLTLLAGTIDLLVAGWEMVGISSALLIGFFHYRDQPAQHGYTAWIAYRICDVALILATVAWHQQFDTARFDVSPQGLPEPRLLLAILLLVASLAKSAQLPLSWWLPKAMEGPTPSSALFYGGLSIHAGAYLLLRTRVVWQASGLVPFLIVLIGVSTAIYGTTVGLARPDAKSKLAFACLSQVGLIFAEIGLGLTTLAIWHLMGHALLRTLQFLRAPSLLQDHNLFGTSPASGPRFWERMSPDAFRTWIYRQAVAGFSLEESLRWAVVGPVLKVAVFFERVEDGWLARFAPRDESKGGLK